MLLRALREVSGLCRPDGTIRIDLKANGHTAAIKVMLATGLLEVDAGAGGPGPLHHLPVDPKGPAPRGHASHAHRPRPHAFHLPPRRQRLTPHLRLQTACTLKKAPAVIGGGLNGRPGVCRAKDAELRDGSSDHNRSGYAKITVCCDANEA